LRKTLASLLIVTFLLAEALFGLSGKEVRYAGGTIAEIAPNAVGVLDLSDQAAVFTTKNGKAKVSMPYAAIQSLEYGQKAGRHVAAAVIISPLFLFSKKRKHFLTIEFIDAESKKQGAVFELSKGIVSRTLDTLGARSGKKVEYESDEARKYAEKH
jgi:hypothetical protein